MFGERERAEFLCDDLSVGVRANRHPALILAVEPSTFLLALYLNGTE